jgi:hypothetical protein
MSGVTSETAPVILARRSTTSAGKGGKYALSLTMPYKKKSRGLPFKVVKQLLKHSV